jgi:hypothetical protein
VGWVPLEILVVVLKRNHVGKHQQSSNSPYFGALVHDGALGKVGIYKDALAEIVQWSPVKNIRILENSTL